MPTVQFCLSLAVLLLTPGPTNTLMALAGAERGWARALRLAPVEVAAYGIVTIPLALAGDSLLDPYGQLRIAISLVAAAWVAILALRLWNLPLGRAMATGGQGARKLFVTTLLNPKGLVIGLVLLPSQPDIVSAAAAFFAILIAVSAVWAAIGNRMAGAGFARGRMVHRACACWLGLLSLWLGSAAFTA
jgi:threonine/homoserine/homoserine lactone efflux protein